MYKHLASYRWVHEDGAKKENLQENWTCYFKDLRKTKTKRLRALVLTMLWQQTLLSGLANNCRIFIRDELSVWDGSFVCLRWILRFGINPVFRWIMWPNIVVSWWVCQHVLETCWRLSARLGDMLTDELVEEKFSHIIHLNIGSIPTLCRSVIHPRQTNGPSQTCNSS